MNTQLPIEFVGFRGADLAGFKGRMLRCITWPTGQASQCAWRLELFWEGDKAWTVQGKSTMTDSGHEMGSLRIEESFQSSLPQDYVRAALNLDGFNLAEFQVASASEADVTADCAIALIADDGRELIISTAPASGAVALWRWGKSRPKTEYDPSSLVWRPANPSGAD